MYYIVSGMVFFNVFHFRCCYFKLIVFDCLFVESNDVDMILYSVFENGYKQCTDGALGTYVSAVPTFVQGYLSQKEQDAEDQGQDYEYPDAAQYIACTAYQINNKDYFFQLGCSGESNLAIEVKIYEDNACTQLSSLESSVATDIDVSAIQVRCSTFCLPSHLRAKSETNSLYGLLSVIATIQTVHDVCSLV
jgi:hypothetical protein